MGNGSDEIATDETTAATAVPATTVAPAATVAAVATTTEGPTTTEVASAAVSPATAIATVQALQDALNAYDADAALAFYDEWSADIGGSAGSVAWEQFLALDGVVGMHGTLSDCELVDGELRCLWTQEETLLSGKAGVVYTYTKGFTFTEEGLVLGSFWEELSGSEEHAAFQEALGEWMASAHPEAHERFYVLAFQTTNDENWSTPEGVAELSPLIDEFVAQSDEYPLRETATTDSSSDEFNGWYVGTWKSGIWHQQYSEDGTYRVGGSATGVESSPIEVGTYEFDGETLRIRAFDDSEYCAGIEAVYEAEFSESGTVVTHTLVTDDCGVRVRGKDQQPFRKLP